MMSTIEYFNFKFNLRAIFSVVVFENGYASIKFILVLYIDWKYISTTVNDCYTFSLERAAGRHEIFFVLMLLEK